MPNAPRLFQRARDLCRIARGVAPPKWLERAPIAGDCRSRPAWLRELAVQAATWQKYDKRAHEWEDTLPPAWVIETLLARSWSVPAAGKRDYRADPPAGR